MRKNFPVHVMDIQSTITIALDKDMSPASFTQALLNGGLNPSLEESSDDISPQVIRHFRDLSGNADIILV